MAMFSDNPPQIINKRMSFPSVLIVCVTSIVITAVVSTAGVGVYGLRIVDRKSDGLVSFLGQLTDKLPQLRDALPPALQDAMDDERRPDYRANLRVSVTLVGEADRRHRRRAAVEVENKGDETISLLTMRIVALDKDGNPVGERQTWAVSPLQMDGDWRGPLLPHETRRFSVKGFDVEDAASVSHEITDLRVWCGYDESQDKPSKGVMALDKSVRRTIAGDI